MLTYKQILQTAGIMSLLVALLHLVMIPVGAKAYEFFAAGKEMVQAAQRGSLLPGILTFGIAVVFVIFALYGFAGAGIISTLPKERIALYGIGLIFTLRGLGLFVQVALLLAGKSGENLASKDLTFSLASLGIGLLYLSGTWLKYKH